MALKLGEIKVGMSTLVAMNKATEDLENRVEALEKAPKPKTSKPKTPPKKK